MVIFHSVLYVYQRVDVEHQWTSPFDILGHWSRLINGQFIPHLVGGLEHFLFFHTLGLIIIFQRGWNHPPTRKTWNKLHGPRILPWHPHWKSQTLLVDPARNLLPNNPVSCLCGSAKSRVSRCYVGSVREGAGADLDPMGDGFLTMAWSENGMIDWDIEWEFKNGISLISCTWKCGVHPEVFDLNE